MGRRPAMQSAEQREIISRDVMPGQILSPRQVREHVDKLFGSVFVNSIAVEVGDDDAMDFSCSVKQIIRFNIEA